VKKMCEFGGPKYGTKIRSQKNFRARVLPQRQLPTYRAPNTPQTNTQDTLCLRSLHQAKVATAWKASLRTAEPRSTWGVLVLPSAQHNAPEWAPLHVATIGSFGRSVM
jgi:hypothetical protein